MCEKGSPCITIGGYFHVTTTVPAVIFEGQYISYGRFSITDFTVCLLQGSPHVYVYVYYSTSDQIEDVNYGVCTTAYAVAHSPACHVKRCPPKIVLAVINVLTIGTELLHLIQVSNPALGLSYKSTHATLNEHTYESCSLRMNYNQKYS